VKIVSTFCPLANATQDWKEGLDVNNFVKGILVGVGVGLLVAPLSGQETRRVLRERYDEWRDSLPEDSRVNQYANQVSERVSQTKENLQQYAEQAVSAVKDKSNTLGNKAQQYAGQAVSKVKDTGNTLSDKAQQSAQQTKQMGQDADNKAKQSGSARTGSSPATRIMPETNTNTSQD
jgi:gas vesicle protein